MSELAKPPRRRGAPHVVAGMAVLVALSLASRCGLASRRAERCSLDGSHIEPVYEVELVEGEDVLARFCCLRCAQAWPEVPARAYWRVRDEITGRPLDSRKASFVESPVVTVAATRCRLHAFESWVDAADHVATYGGERVADPLVRPQPPEDEDANDR
jgi:hypothetical protein